MRARLGVGCVAITVLLGVAAGAFVLHTDLGIFVLGYRYYMSRAASASQTSEIDRDLQRVLDATQYGVNNAENYVLSLKSREKRVVLWQHLVVLAPNSNWRHRYEVHLNSEYALAPPQGSAKPSSTPR